VDLRGTTSKGRERRRARKGERGREGGENHTGTLLVHFEPCIEPCVRWGAY